MHEAKSPIQSHRPMLSSPAAFDLAFGSDDDWIADPGPRAARLYRAASVGNSWGVTSMGRGFDWEKRSDETDPSADEGFLSAPRVERSKSAYDSSGSEALLAAKRRNRRSQNSNPHSTQNPGSLPMVAATPPSPQLPIPMYINTQNCVAEPVFSLSPNLSRPASPRPMTPGSVHSASSSRHPTLPRPRRRSSQQRVSLIAGRVLIAPIDAPPSPILPPSVLRSGSANSLAKSPAVEAPPLVQSHSFLGEKRISDYSIEKEIGRGAYGLVKLARERQSDGSLGPAVVVKQVIKSRILADCWKRHPKYGTIPIEIHVMSAISAMSYQLPHRRPWDPARSCLPEEFPKVESTWIDGKVVLGHPNICPLLDFFEDNHYYYLVLPCTTPEQRINEPPPPSDLFDLVESYPQGLPPSSIRSYLGQLADALAFLHSQGIVHRDVKDENVVLGAAGQCVLIDFGSSGLVKSGGWDTFSGTLDYAGPEILRGERYHGKEQDVWAFGVVAYVLLVGECPFVTSEDAQAGLKSPFSNPTIALDERCGEDNDRVGEESDGGGALGDAAALVRACLQVEVSARPTFDKILESRFLSGGTGWS